MIRFIAGALAEKSPGLAVVECGGIGYALHVSMTTYESLPSVGDRVRLLTHLHFSADSDQLALFGFAERDEYELFVTLIGISGIGPKGALKILSRVVPRDFVEAVASENMDYLTALPGVGQKSAARIIVELKEKLPALLKTRELVPGLSAGKAEEVVAALAALGMSRYESKKALDRVFAGLGEKQARELSAEELIREALKAGR